MSTLTGLARLDEIASSLRDEFGINPTDSDILFGQGTGWLKVRAAVERLSSKELGPLIAASPHTEQFALHKEGLLRSLHGAQSDLDIVQRLAVNVIMRRIQSLCKTAS